MTAHHIVPPYLLEHLERTADDPNLRARYRQSLQHDAVLRTRRAAAPVQDGVSGQGPRRVVHDAENGTSLPGRVVRSEGEAAVADSTVNQAYDGTGATWTMFSECFGRDSVDGAGLTLISTVHYDHDYANAFWDGSQMVFGDGDGRIFGDFTSSIDVTGHELTHGVTQYTANLAFEGQPGALNESISDVFGSLAKQHHLGQSAADADWLIGADIFLPGVSGAALRSMKAPGTAYDDPRLGRDPQPAHMSGYVETTDDSGGVHINSGIPNHAFYLAATELGGNAYDDAGKIWYATLTSGTLAEASTFVQFAQATQSAATDLFGADSAQLTAVTTAWQQVGVLPTTDAERSAPPAPGEAAPSPEADAAPAQPGDAVSPPDSEPSEVSGRSAESVELMRAAHTALSTHTPPAPPAAIPPTPTAPADPSPADTSSPPPDTPAVPSDDAPASDTTGDLAGDESSRSEGEPGDQGEAPAGGSEEEKPGRRGKE